VDDAVLDRALEELGVTPPRAALGLAA
jgi:hypothetical protein